MDGKKGRRRVGLCLGCFCISAFLAFGDTHYADRSNPTPHSPYLTWGDAATSIQEAVDVASSGDVVRVADGVYDAGGTVVFGMTNRVTINKPIVVESANGWPAAVIRGQGPTGDAAVRCVYLASNASLSGFTLTGGYTRVTGPGWENDCDGGGAYCENNTTISNCLITGNSAFHGGGVRGYSNTIVKNCSIIGNSALPNSYASSGGGAAGCHLMNCEIIGNRAGSGGGVGGGIVEDCTLSGNLSVRDGGGACGSVIHHSDVVGNVARGWGGGGLYECWAWDCTINGNTGPNGGGVYWSYMTNCTITGNTASYGGGLYQGTTYRCIVLNNFASNSGGGVCNGFLKNCLIAGNSTVENGGGGYFSGGGTLQNCTIFGNSANVGGGIAYGDAVENCIIVSNTASPSQTASGRQNYFTVYSGTMNYVCTMPLPESGVGNRTNDPSFVDAASGDWRLAANSSCIDAGSNQTWMTGSADLDRRPRILHNTVDLGAYEAVLPEWDTDGDHMRDAQELPAGTDPNNSASFLGILSLEKSVQGHIVSWSSVDAHRYRLSRSTNLMTDAFTVIVTSNQWASPPMNVETDKTVMGNGPWFYRIEVE
ncbi:MAG TPA: hypothetical protein DCZ95_02790 [Verrucomicrobia bacterium]|nr:MAG: hypothetical protein A2X46_14855 [Lentisphaerae bacterium GWF2_57_35]HBA82999.1 hypothetical protein [Verrucomicrobiota bacterium]